MIRISFCTSEILNTHHFSTTQYAFSIFYLPTQIQMDIVYPKPGFKRGFLKISNV